jgi:asparagine synthase (glutamine-hydrolysing)
MTARIHDRCPDAEGVWASEGVVLDHRRLAILDLDSRANQPMVSTDGRYTIVFQRARFTTSAKCALCSTRQSS